ncbi:aquaporin Z [soil metagenome]
MIRRYAAEFIGTFAIVFAPLALANSSSLLEAALISGLAVAAMVFALGPISAAHFNPAVTIAFATAKRFPWRFVPAYLASQFAGAVLAAVTAKALYGSISPHIPADPTAITRNLGTEIAISFLLMLVIISVATDKRAGPSTPGIAIGGAVVMGVIIGGPVTGGSMNPFRSLGPALITGGQSLQVVWLYIIGPILGALAAALTYEAIRIEHAASVAAPNDLLESLTEIQNSK